MLETARASKTCAVFSARAVLVRRGSPRVMEEAPAASPASSLERASRMLQHYDDDSTPEYGLLNLFLVSLALLAMIAATTWLFAFTRDGEPYEALTEAPSANRVSLYSKPPDKEIVLLVSLPSALEPRVNVNVHLGATLDANVTPISVTVRLGYGGQHTLRWDSAVERLPPGTCNLYAFPSYTPAASSDPVVASGSELATLRSLVRGLATAKAVEARAGDPSDAMKVADSSGARLVHGLLIANNADAVTLAVEMLELRPALLPIAHVEGPFEGENCLHVLAVNRRQGEMLRLLALATAHLDDEGLRQLLLTPATGSFFTSEPMRSYGGTAFGYACAFRAKRVLNHILDEPRLAALVDLRRPQPNACPISGFLPLHVCVANGRPDVFDLLVARGAHPSETTVHRSKQVTDLDLTPLQLACRLGDHEMTEHILDSRLRIQWVWGPVTSYMLPLDEIEDRGGSHDLMELMLAPDASAQTRRMLLDGFMSGFLWNLFLQKWQRFGRSLHVALRMIDLLSLALLFGLGISLKERPLEADRLLLPVLGGIACACQLLYEVINAALWYEGEALEAIPLVPQSRALRSNAVPFPPSRPLRSNARPLPRQVPRQDAHPTGGRPQDQRARAVGPRVHVGALQHARALGRRPGRRDLVSPPLCRAQGVPCTPPSTAPPPRPSAPCTAPCTTLCTAPSTQL